MKKNKIMKKNKRIFFSIVSVAMSLTVVGCDETPNATKALTAEDVLIWSAPATEKVLQDKGVEEYADVKGDASISLVMAKGEYEGSQIIITPTVDVPSYTISVTDLTHTDGTSKIEKENIGIYQEKYVPVTAKMQKNDATPGMYPDAIVPFDAIVKYKENKVEKNENQGIYVNFQTLLDQEVGVYTGSMKIDFGTFVQNVPISINVVNAQVSQENNAKSCILTSWTYQHGELNSTQEMRDAYTDALIKYRLAPSTLMQENDHSPEMIKLYVEKAYHYMQNPRFSNCSIPYATTPQEYAGDGESYDCIDPDVFESYLYAFAEKSFETGYNMPKKLVVYNAIIDEPMWNGCGNQVNINAKVFNNTVEKVATALEADTTITSIIKDEVVESIRKIPHILTEKYYDTWGDRTGDEYMNTFCPTTDAMDSEMERAKYEVQDETWWYLANNQKYPYPSWQLDSNDSLAPRLMGWMQGEYDITGVLYWSANWYVKYDAATGESVMIEDYYGENAKRSHHQSTLEGILFHPGGQYGLSEPVGSLRLEAIRDGLEEYELLQSLKQKYEALGYNADSLISSLTSSLYLGTQISANNGTFATARQSLLELCSALQSPAEMCIVSSEDSGNGKIETKVFLKDGFTLKSDGKEVTAVTPATNGKIYTVVSNLSNTENYLKLSFEANGTTYTYTQFLGGKVTGVELNDLKSAFASNNATVTASIEEARLKLNIGATDGKVQRISFKSTILQRIDKTTQKVMLKIYNGNEKDVQLAIKCNFEKDILLSTFADITLKAGEYTTVELNFSNTTWDKLGKIKDMYFLFNESSTAEVQKTLYIDSFAIYNQ